MTDLTLDKRHKAIPEIGQYFTYKIFANRMVILAMCLNNHKIDDDDDDFDDGDIISINCADKHIVECGSANGLNITLEDNYYLQKGHYVTEVFTKEKALDLYAEYLV